jgi:deoxyribodipyrimidine photo-lyase
LRRLRGVDKAIVRRWPQASSRLLADVPRGVRRLPIDHEVPAVTEFRGGFVEGRRALTSFVRRRLARYHDAHNHPDDRGTSRLSPYLHFGHLAAHEVFDAVMEQERWTARRLAERATGRRDGWWGVEPGAEAFLDQLVVWRELALNTCAQCPDDYDAFDSLPAWALKTLAEHETDSRAAVYTREEFEAAATHDPLWNAAQRELRERGWFHNYMRMLWGKKILEWSASPREALETMIHIMNRWSLDGRDPNSYAGYFWTLGRYDRPWPEREIYGKVRSMSSAQTKRKVRAAEYLNTFGKDRS